MKINPVEKLKFPIFFSQLFLSLVKNKYCIELWKKEDNFLNPVKKRLINTR